jgi:glutathione peroxidase
MKSIFLIFGLCLMAISGFAASNAYEFEMKRIDGEQASLSAYRGKVALFVNVASRCGYTPQYEGLEALYKEYQGKGFVILGFPANNFGSQEPGSNAEIADFCKRTYGVSFPMFAKISVKGPDQDTLYQYLTSKEANPATSGDVRWNFTKFLVGKDGKVLARFDSKVTPDAPELRKAINEALK